MPNLPFTKTGNKVAAHEKNRCSKRWLKKVTENHPLRSFPKDIISRSSVKSISPEEVENLSPLHRIIALAPSSLSSGSMFSSKIILW